jgi:membrane protease YdiL (CAAX protease family)
MAGARRILAVRGLAFWQVVAICCLAAPLSFTADRVQKVMEWSRPQLRLEAIVRGGAGPDAWKDGLIYSCVLVPAIEEMFFRGYLGRGLVARYGAIVGMILTSLLSGAFSLDLIHAAPLAVRALACHVAYLSSKSIVAPIVLHGLCNGLKFTAYMDATPFLKISALAAFGCLMVLIWQMRTRWVTAGQDWRPSYESAEMPPTALKASARMCRPSWPALVAAIGTALIFAVALGLRMQAMFEELGNVPRAQGEDGRLVCVASGRQGFGCEKSPSSGVPSENL